MPAVVQMMQYSWVLLMEIQWWEAVENRQPEEAARTIINNPMQLQRETMDANSILVEAIGLDAALALVLYLRRQGRTASRYGCGNIMYCEISSGDNRNRKTPTPLAACTAYLNLLSMTMASPTATAPFSMAMSLAALNTSALRRWS